MNEDQERAEAIAFARDVAMLDKWVTSTTPEYDAYMRSPKWQRMRFLVLNKIAQNRCMLCYAPGPGLEVHHRTYERFGNERSTDLIALCKPCHDLADERRRLVRRMEVLP